MKVLIVHPGTKIYGGAERVIVKLCEYLSKQAIVHTLAMPKVPAEMKADLPETPVISDIFTLAANINEFDVVNFHNFPATLFSMFSNKPMVWYLNEPAEMFTKPWRKPIEWGNRNLVRVKIENVAVADKFNARRCFDIYGVVPKIIPYGIDYEFFSECVYAPDSEYFTVMQVGTISRYKNQLETVRAVAAVRQHIPNIRLWFVGNVSDPDYKAEIEDLIRDLQLGGIVSWEPHVDREHLRFLYTEANVLMHPVKEQGGWLSPFEAISAGCPVITSKELTCSEMIKENMIGIVSDNYASSLRFVNDQKPEIKVMTDIARRWVNQNLTWNKFGESMVKYFEEVLK